jgi:hypothetical protein
VIQSINAMSGRLQAAEYDNFGLNDEYGEPAEYDNFDTLKLDLNHDINVLVSPIIDGTTTHDNSVHETNV